MRCTTGYARTRSRYGERPGLTTHESAELAKAKKRIRQLEAEVEILKRAAKLLGEDRRDPKGLIR